MANLFQQTLPFRKRLAMKSTFHILMMCWLPVAMFVAAAAEEPKKPERPARVLIVTGVEYHAWKETAPAIQKVLERDKRIEARIVEDPEFLATPVVADYDVIFLHIFTDNHQQFKRENEIRKNLATLIRQGKGLVVFHLACGAFQDWPEYVNLAGRVWDRKTFHDPRGPFQVHLVQKDHAITRAMSDFQADDELYVCLTGATPVEVLATAHSKMMNKDYPMAFVFDYGKGRVFHTALGHDPRAIEMPGTAELLRRGCLWAAGRPTASAPIVLQPTTK
jgi:uncharacterized protein